MSAPLTICTDCQLPTNLFWEYKKQDVCMDCIGTRERDHMRRCRKITMFLSENEVISHSGSFRLSAILKPNPFSLNPSIKDVWVIFEDKAWKETIDLRSENRNVKLYKEGKVKLMPLEESE